MSWQQIVGGTLQGLGRGVSQYGTQLRDARLQEIARTSRELSEADNRDFRAAEAEKDRQFRTVLQEDQQAFTKSQTTTKLDAEKPYMEARTDLVRAQASNEEKGLGHGNSSASVANREHLKSLFMNSSEGSRQQGESDADYTKRVNDWLLKVETQRDSKSDRDLWLEAVKMAQSDAATSINGPEAVQKKAEELFSAMKGMQQGPTGAKADPAVSGGSQQSKPAGEGTEASPFVGATQSDIEWFKQSAPDGAIIQVNGKLYRK